MEPAFSNVPEVSVSYPWLSITFFDGKELLSTTGGTRGTDRLPGGCKKMAPFLYWGFFGPFILECVSKIFYVKTFFYLYLNITKELLYLPASENVLPPGPFSTFSYSIDRKRRNDLFYSTIIAPMIEGLGANQARLFEARDNHYSTRRQGQEP